MKKITQILFIAFLAVLASCEGVPGPPGRDGFDGKDGKDGKDGDSFLGSVFEIEGDFTSENDYTLYYAFPSTLKVYDSDIVLVYILWELAEAEDGSILDVWRLLPQTVVIGDEGILQYNYDYTVGDVQIFLEGTIDFNTLLPAEAENQIFRIAVLPADFAHSKSLDIQDFNMVMKHCNKPIFQDLSLQQERLVEK